MKKKVSFVAVGWLISLSLFFLAVGIAYLVLSTYWPDLIPSVVTDFLVDKPYITFSVFGVALVLAFIGIIVFAAKRHNQKVQRAQFNKELSDLASGQVKVMLGSSKEYEPETKILNDSALLETYERPVYGTHDAEEFDEVLVKQLENEPETLSGVALLLFDQEGVEQGPKDALFLMAHEHFGDRVHYGKLDEGLAIFTPILASREEFLGRVRTVVRLYSYSLDNGVHIAVKGGVAFFPDFPPKYLTIASLKEAMGKDILQQITSDSEIPHRGYKASERDTYLKAARQLRYELHKATTEERVTKAFKSFVMIGLPHVGGSVAGALYFDEVQDAYELLYEEVDEGQGLSSIAENGWIKKEVIDPFFEWSAKERGSVFAGKRVYLPSHISSILDSLGIQSIGCVALMQAGKKLGFAYVLSPLEHRFEEDVYAHNFLRVMEEYAGRVISFRLANKQEDLTSTVLSTFEHYVYAVKKNSFELSYVSPNMASAIPEAKIGATCHKVLFGKDTPCKNCPIFNDDVEMMIPQLSSGVYAYRVAVKEKETMLILSPHRRDFSSIRIDPVTGILSDQSLHEDLQQEILLRDAHGCILAFRLRNADTIMRMFRWTEIDEAMKIASTALASSSLARSLYRNGKNGFAYLLPYTQKEDAFVLAEKVQKALSGKFDCEGKSLEFILDFVCLSYPLEAETPFVLDSLLRVLYQRADASGRGRLFEVDREQGRLVDYENYAKTKLEDAIRMMKIPLRFRLYRELAGKKVAYLDAMACLLDEGGSPIEDETLYSLAESVKKRGQLDLALANSLGKFLITYKRNIQESALRGLILRINASCFNDLFLGEFNNALFNNKANARHIFLEVSLEDARAHEFEAFYQKAKEKGFRFGLSGYVPGIEKELLQKFSYISFSDRLIYGKSKGDFIKSLADVRSLGLNILVEGFVDEEERHYLASLACHFGSDANEAPAMEKEAVGLLE